MFVFLLKAKDELPPFSPLLPSLPFPPVFTLPPFHFLRSRTLWTQLGGLKERCKLPQWGRGQSPSRQTIWCILTSNSAALVAAVFLFIFLRTNVQIHVWDPIPRRAAPYEKLFSWGTRHSTVALWKSAPIDVTQWTQLTVVRSTQPSTLRGMVNWVSAFRLSIVINGDGECSHYSGL